ncbi:MAG: hypothetical protein J1D77_03145 [Muribaculaceae bacterium]|nr:hypothetical protein [Muribaculaceae bacterium]
MQKKIKKYIDKRSFCKPAMVALAATVWLTGCREDNVTPEVFSSDGIHFGAVITGPEQLLTRANNNTYNITTEFYDCKYHVRVEGQDYDKEWKSKAATYVIPSGYEATIIPDTDQTPLNWFSRDGEHDFWAWTWPHDLSYAPDNDDPREEITLIFEDTDLNGTTSSSAGTWREDSWKNGKALEQLIGAHTGPSVYNEHGMYVPLRFRHLVSKIIISKFYVVDNVNGTTIDNLKGTITFYGMPRETKLLTSPRDAEGNPMSPRVALPEGWDYDPSVGVKYAVCNSGLALRWEGYDPYYYASTMPRDCWYIPPELDFSQLSFKIEIFEYQNGNWELSQTHGKHGAYYGDFRNVTFSRSSNGSGYDDTVNPGSDVNILHAGEYLSLTINLYEKGNPVVHGNILDWTTSSKESPGHSHIQQGLYSVEEVRELSSVMNGTDSELKEQYYELFGSGKTTADDYPKDEYPDYKEIYGKDLKIFELYDDIGSEAATSGTSSSKVFDLYVNDDYILDGRGHTINVTSSYVYTGNIRDVYLRYYNSSSSTYTEYVVYIDKMGDIWRVDPETYEMTATGLSVIHPEYRSFTLWIWNPPRLDFSASNLY